MAQGTHNDESTLLLSQAIVKQSISHQNQFRPPASLHFSKHFIFQQLQMVSRCRAFSSVHDTTRHVIYSLSFRSCQFISAEQTYQTGIYFSPRFVGFVSFIFINTLSHINHTCLFSRKSTNQMLVVKLRLFFEKWEKRF